MNLQERKQKLWYFIFQRMQKDEFKRRGNEVMGFHNYDDFVQHQVNYVSALDESHLTTIEWLRDSFLASSRLMDKEYMSPRRPSGFCFDSDNRVVLFCER